MLKISLAELQRGDVRLREDVPADDPLWEGFSAPIQGPVHVDLHARPVGSGGVLVSGGVQGEMEFSCRRCLTPVRRAVDEDIEFYLRPRDEHDDDDAESYLLPEGSSEVEVGEAVREQLLLKVPEFVVCREECRGFCPTCGSDLNRSECNCEPERDPGPWDALRNIKFD